MRANNYTPNQVTSSMVRTQNFKSNRMTGMRGYKKDHIVENSLPSMTDDNSINFSQNPKNHGSSILYKTAHRTDFTSNSRNINNSYDGYQEAQGKPFGVSMDKNGISINLRNRNCGNSYRMTNQININ